MKRLYTIVLLFLGMNALAQHDPAIGKSKMKVFDKWGGTWSGESRSYGPNGAGRTSRVEESIQFKLDSTVLLIEGIGKAKKDNGEEIIVHNAMAVLSFDIFTGSYKFDTYLSDGRSTRAWFHTISENDFQWGFEAPQVRMRYTIHLDGDTGTWAEIGEYSKNGIDWMKVIEMKLTRMD